MDAQQPTSAMLKRVDPSGKPLYKVTSGGNIIRTKPITKCMKKRILKRDGGACVECDVVEQTMHIAHIEAYRIAGNNADDNLRTLCEPCHKLEAGR